MIGKNWKIIDHLTSQLDSKWLEIWNYITIFEISFSMKFQLRSPQFYTYHTVYDMVNGIPYTTLIIPLILSRGFLKLILLVWFRNKIFQFGYKTVWSKTNGPNNKRKYARTACSRGLVLHHADIGLYHIDYII